MSGSFLLTWLLFSNCYGDRDNVLSSVAASSWTAAEVVMVQKGWEVSQRLGLGALIRRFWLAAPGRRDREESYQLDWFISAFSKSRAQQLKVRVQSYVLSTPKNLIHERERHGSWVEQQWFRLGSVKLRVKLRDCVYVKTAQDPFSTLLAKCCEQQNRPWAVSVRSDGATVAPLPKRFSGSSPSSLSPCLSSPFQLFWYTTFWQDRPLRDSMLLSCPPSKAMVCSFSVWSCDLCSKKPTLVAIVLVLSLGWLLWYFSWNEEHGKRESELELARMESET